jgi:hypothetical protein
MVNQLKKKRKKNRHLNRTPTKTRKVENVKQ